MILWGCISMQVNRGMRDRRIENGRGHTLHRTQCVNCPTITAVVGTSSSFAIYVIVYVLSKLKTFTSTIYVSFREETDSNTSLPAQ